LDFRIVQHEVDCSFRDIEFNQVSRTHDRKRAAHRSLGSDVQNYRSKACTAHAAVAYPDHVGYSGFLEFPRIRDHPPLGHARHTAWSCILKYENALSVDVQVGVINSREHIRVVPEHYCSSLVDHETGICGRYFHDSTAWCEVSLQDGEGRRRCNRVVQSPNNFTFRYPMISQQLTDRLTGVISDRQIEYGLHGFHHARYSAVAIELIDEMAARRLNIGDTRNGAADGIELVGIKVDAQSACYGSQMEDCIRRSTQRHTHTRCIAKRFARHDIGGFQALEHHLNDPPSGFARQGISAFVVDGERTQTQRHNTKRFQQSIHGRRCAHGVTRAEATTQCLTDLVPFLFSDLTGAQLIPVFPEVRPAAKSLALEYADTLRPCVELQRWKVCAARAHKQARHGLVAVAEQHDTIHWIRPGKAYRVEQILNVFLIIFDHELEPVVEQCRVDTDVATDVFLPTGV